MDTKDVKINVYRCCVGHSDGICPDGAFVEVEHMPTGLKIGEQVKPSSDGIIKLKKHEMVLKLEHLLHLRASTNPLEHA